MPQTHSLGVEEPAGAGRLLAKPSSLGFAPCMPSAWSTAHLVNLAKSSYFKAQVGTSQTPWQQPLPQNSQGMLSFL